MAVRRPLRYFRLPFASENEGVWEELDTTYINKHAEGTERLQELQGFFKFGMAPKSKDLPAPELESGDQICITNYDITEVIAYGTIINPDRKFISWDYSNSRPFFKYIPQCLPRSFDNLTIDKMTYTDTSIQTIIGDILDFADSFLNDGSGNEFLMFFDDFNVDFSIEKYSVTQALLELFNTYDFFLRNAYSVQEDSTYVLDFKRWLEIYDKNGVPDQTGNFKFGFTTEIMKTGKIPNTDVSTRDSISQVIAERKFDISEDPSVIVNELELSGNIYDQADASAYSRWDQQAELGKFDYDLQAIAQDIAYVFLTQLSPTKSLTGHSTTQLKVPANLAVRIGSGDFVIFPERSKVDIYEIDSVNEVDDFITEVNFPANIGFTPNDNETVELCENITIFDANQASYADTGVTKDVNKSNFAKIRFLPLSDPPPTRMIIALYTKVRPYKYVAQDQESIDRYFKRYKEIQLPDDIVLTASEFKKFANNALIRKPKREFQILTNRQGIAPPGMRFAVNVDEWEKDNFTLVENSWTYKGNCDPTTGLPIIDQEITFSNNIKTFDSIVNNFIKSKRKATTTSEIDRDTTQKEELVINEIIEVITTQLSLQKRILLIENTGSLLQPYYILENGFGKTIIDDDGNNISSANTKNIVFDENTFKYYFLLQISGFYELCSMDYNLTNFNQITSFGFDILDFVISHDGSKFLYTKDTVGVGNINDFQIFTANIDGSGSNQVTSETYGAYYGDWSPDDTLIIYCAHWAQTGHGIYTKNSGGSGSPTLWYTTGLRNYQVRWSKDGEKIGLTFYYSGGTTPGYYVECRKYSDTTSYGLSGLSSGRHSTFPRFSPDSLHLLFSRNLNGTTTYRIEKYTIGGSVALLHTQSPNSLTTSDWSNIRTA